MQYYADTETCFHFQLNGAWLQNYFKMFLELDCLDKCFLLILGVNFNALNEEAVLVLFIQKQRHIHVAILI